MSNPLSKACMSFGVSFSVGLFAYSLVFAPIFNAPAAADSRYASNGRNTTAVAHYSRARTMCVETLEEFEAGRRYARPDLLLDADEWRLSMISLCEKLNRLVAPKIRVTRNGVQVSASPRLIRRLKDRLPESENAPATRNDLGERDRMEQAQDARARLYNPNTEPVKVEEVEEVEEAPEENTELSEEELRQAIEEVALETVKQADKQPTVVEEAKTEAVEVSEEVVTQESESVQNEVTSEEDIAAKQVLGISPGSAVEEPRIISEDEITYAEDVETEENQALEETAAKTISSEEEKALTEDEKIAQAIEQAIQEKLSESEEDISSEDYEGNY